MKEFVRDIISSLQEYAVEERKEFAKKSYPTQTKVIGVVVPNLKIVLKEVKSQTKKWAPEDIIQLSKLLIDTEVFECQQLAYELIGKDKKVLNALKVEDIDDLGKNLDNWISVDYYAALIVGYAWRVGKMNIEKIKGYLLSDDKWIRRIAVVSTVALNQKARGGTGDAVQTLEICQLVVDDHDDMIVKALSWALRELAKIEEQPVAEFLNLNENRLHRRVIREVSHKLNYGTKN